MSEPQFHADRLQKLIDHFRDDGEALEFIRDCVRSFSEYHAAIVEMEFWLKAYNYDNMGDSDYQHQRGSLDKIRTVRHNAVISHVSALNRMAAAAGIEPVYDGAVSEDRPYRRQVANGVLGYIEGLVRERI